MCVFGIAGLLAYWFYTYLTLCCEQILCVMKNNQRQLWTNKKSLTVDSILVVVDLFLNNYLN